MNAPVTIKGWCPTALRPMMSGDGLLVRVSARHAAFRPDTLQAVASLAQRYGNGAIDLTSRANLQIRGVRDRDWRTLVDQIAEHDLIPPGDPSGVPVHVIVSPLAGLDSCASFDPRPLAGEIEEELLRDPRFAALPSKFGFAVDGGGAFPLGDVGADLSLRPSADRRAVLVQPAGAKASARLSVAQAPAAALGLARSFLALRRDERRMRPLLARVGAPAFFAAASLPFVACEDRPQTDGRGTLGAFHVGGILAFGVAAPFGAWTAEALDAIAAVTPAATIRVTPWRVLLLAGLDAVDVTEVLRVAAAHDLIVAPADPRWSVAACVGAPACSSATVATRPLSRDLARLLPGDDDKTTLHVSGCAKGCAHPRPAPLTLVGREGCFDLVVDGATADAPLVTGLDAASAARAVQERRLA